MLLRYEGGLTKRLTVHMHREAVETRELVTNESQKTREHVEALFEEWMGSRAPKSVSAAQEDLRRAKED
eukprot:6530293-Alexandrium_andersonii.AAC.1